MAVEQSPPIKLICPPRELCTGLFQSFYTNSPCWLNQYRQCCHDCLGINESLPGAWLWRLFCFTSSHLEDSGPYSAWHRRQGVARKTESCPPKSYTFVREYWVIFVSIHRLRATVLDECIHEPVYFVTSEINGYKYALNLLYLWRFYSNHTSLYDCKNVTYQISKLRSIRNDISKSGFLAPWHFPSASHIHS